MRCFLVCMAVVKWYVVRACYTNKGKSWAAVCENTACAQYTALLRPFPYIHWFVPHPNLPKSNAIFYVTYAELYFYIKPNCTSSNSARIVANTFAGTSLPCRVQSPALYLLPPFRSSPIFSLSVPYAPYRDPYAR